MIRTVLLSSALIGTGLVSGLFYGWAVSVNPGLKRVPDTTYVTTMQNINRAIINPLFLIPFLGVPVVLAGATISQFRAGDARRGWYLASATVIYLFGVLGITVGGNVPLNNALDSFDLAAASEQALATRRQTYETPWVRWHNIRTAASVVSFSLVSVAAIISDEPS